MPNYNSSEKIITNSKNATYTVTKNSWIMYEIQARWDPIIIKINNIEIARVQILTNEFAVRYRGIAPVKIGDVVKIWTESTFDDSYASVWLLSNR